MILYKTDLLPYVRFYVEEARAKARQINPRSAIIQTSCTDGAGLDK